MADINKYEFTWSIVSLLTRELEAGSRVIAEINMNRAYEKFKQTEDFSRIKEITPYADDFFQIKFNKYSTPDELIRVKKLV